MRKNIKYTVVTLFVLCLFSNSAFSRTYKFGLVEWMPWGTAYIAAEKGFWKSEGIDVEITQFRNYENEHLKAFQNSKVDFSTMMLGNAIEMIVQSPEHIIIHEHNWSQGGDMFIVSNQLKDLVDLKGKKIGLYSNSAPISFFMNKILEKAGLSMKDVSLSENSNLTNLSNAFILNMYSAIISYDPEASKVLSTNKGKLLFTSADFPGAIPEGIATHNSIIQNNPEDVKKFMRGWLKAVKWQANPENQKEYFAIMNKTMFKNSPYSDEKLKEFESGGKIHSSFNSILERNEKGVYEYVEELLNYLKQTGVNVEYSQTEKYVNTSFSTDEAKEIFK
jgi:NitT/TauT family transport system substrate-binding protein